MNNTTDDKEKQFNDDIERYREFLRSLDDRETAAQVRLEKTERAKRLVTEILQVTSGVMEVPEDQEFAHKHLFEIFEIFQIRHENFHRADVAEDLQFHIFSETIEHDDSFREFRRASFAESGLDPHGNKPEKTAEPSYQERLFEHHLQVRTNKICHVLASDKVSEDAKEAFKSLILEAANEAGISDGGGDPEVVKVVFPKIIRALDFEYGRGIYHAIGSLLDSNLVAPIEDELEQYSKRFESSPEKAESKDVLDLSKVCTEFLKTRESVEKPVDLAALLSAAMKHPDMPTQLYNVLSDELIHTPDEFSEKPENIQAALDKIKTEQS